MSLGHLALSIASLTFAVLVSSEGRARAENGPREEIVRLCASAPPRSEVEGVRQKLAGQCNGLAPNIEGVIEGVIQHCANVDSYRKSKGREIPLGSAEQIFAYLDGAVRDLRTFLACGALAGTFAELQKLGQEARIKAIWRARADVAARHEAARLEPGVWDRMCLEATLSRFDDAVRHGEPVEQRARDLSEEAMRCALKRESPPPWAIGLTVPGVLLTLGGLATVVWGSTAVCSGRDSNGLCYNGDQVNQRRLAGWIGGGAGAAIGVIFTGFGVWGLTRVGSPGASRAALMIGPGRVGVQGFF